MPESKSSSPTDASLWAVILAGGVGSRFWPVSTPARPKQLLPLAGTTPLITQTVERILPLVPAERIRILTGSALAEPILSATPMLGREHLLLEPRARGTAPVLVWAAHTLAARDPQAVMLSLHSDHVIEPPSAFREVLARAAALSRRHGLLFTLGAVPTRPETGYGYISQGAALTDDGAAHEVARFVEKPDRATAEKYIAEGCLWNTGIFVWPAALLLDEIRSHTPELAALLPLLDAGDVDAWFEQAPSLSIDEGLLERSRSVGVLRAGFEWDDVGAWDAIGRTRATDEHGNVAEGSAHFVDAHSNIAWADDGTIVVFGVDDLVVVRSGGITFVAPRSRTPDLKQLLSELPERLITGD
ncbi:MAG: mannose-1-phosphate guanylyltransferase [Gemmatimonadetes bacterium]|nr:mannose-1-phosphate guanylyltransferase [Gemmatimonadota bacterium]